MVAKTDMQVLFMSAEAINEPVAAKGNFVMNTPEEVEQAMDDYEKGNSERGKKRFKLQ